MYQKVLSYIKEHHMIEKGDLVLAGVSGGADSLCLLLVLLRLQEEIGFDLEVMHVEHGIRGEESLKDAEFVKSFCMERNIPLLIKSVNATEYAAAHGLSVEEAGRILRYRLFEEECDRAESNDNMDSERRRRARIAVAHHRNDQAETVILNMIRGSGIRGAGGIRPVRGRVIRPLLTVTREEIEDFLKENGQEYCTDRTNLETVYARNRIRHEVLPALEEINKGAVWHLAETAEELQDAEEYLRGETKRAYQLCVLIPEMQPEFLLVNKERLAQFPDFLKRRVLYETLCVQAGGRKDLTKEHVALLQELMEKQPGRQVSLPYGLLAERIYEGIRIGKKELLPCSLEQICIAVPGEAQLLQGSVVETGAGTFCFSLHRAEPGMEIPKKKCTKWLDYDKIKNDLYVRTRQSGDYLMLDGAGNKQKLKNYFINEKIPKEERDRLLLLCRGHHVLWIVGYRISEYCKVTKDTKNILEVQFDGGKES